MVGVVAKVNQPPVLYTGVVASSAPVGEPMRASIRPPPSGPAETR